MIKINIYILEDNNAYRNRIQQILQTYKSTLISLEFPTPHNHLNFMSELSSKKISDTDIFILDIDLKTNFTGIDVAKMIRERNKISPIIFLTSMTNQAIMVINESIQAKGYLVKEIHDDLILEANLFSLLSKLEQEILPKRDDKEILTLSTRNETMFFPYSDILYIESVKGTTGKVMVKTVNQNQLINWKIGNVKQHINQEYMYTGLQSFIINLENIHGFNRSCNAIIFKNSEQLLVGLKVFNKVVRAVKEYRDDFT
ncbi:hypothetical protein UAW_01807 [Enterococcus haemoperoxidus ATCC BAA-382]|uniref:Response regulatory domain-containing protein n=1 Tax=Enterococcus haemoperoxidus ATCC BAA-382 TaxID=1158608 RepID=R2QJ56_9ENTE|nr:response regulator [Enterococcus haemoperoxidus]EOH96642.1 hypothetical protein UAW_01807 [Enterococcus haemoperoxidus ATCC BAA-382]EOT60138.1 hypothetical protein I583_02773 [Enterococcus haemoperoxidus ATCC BAA-382]OJG51471.1 hypothetical protein RV06_GL001612 [Enterococcus haemoperoxidus]